MQSKKIVNVREISGIILLVLGIMSFTYLQIESVKQYRNDLELSTIWVSTLYAFLAISTLVKFNMIYGKDLPFINLIGVILWVAVIGLILADINPPSEITSPMTIDLFISCTTFILIWPIADAVDGICTC